MCRRDAPKRRRVRERGTKPRASAGRRRPVGRLALAHATARRRATSGGLCGQRGDAWRPPCHNAAENEESAAVVNPGKLSERTARAMLLMVPMDSGGARGARRRVVRPALTGASALRLRRQTSRRVFAAHSKSRQPMAPQPPPCVFVEGLDGTLRQEPVPSPSGTVAPRPICASAAAAAVAGFTTPPSRKRPAEAPPAPEGPKRTCKTFSFRPPPKVQADVPVPTEPAPLVVVRASRNPVHAFQLRIRTIGERALGLAGPWIKAAELEAAYLRIRVELQKGFQKLSAPLWSAWRSRFQP